MLDFLCQTTDCNPHIVLAQILLLAFNAVLFTQSGIDKVTDWSGNVGWLKGHFEDTIFGGFVPQLVGTITLFELVAGIASAAGAAFIFINGSTEVATAATALSAVTLLQLFAGQRIAKDYPGAAVLVPYMILTVVLLVLLSF